MYYSLLSFIICMAKERERMNMFNRKKMKASYWFEAGSQIGSSDCQTVILMSQLFPID